jgi:hypothetical protein
MHRAASVTPPPAHEPVHVRTHTAEHGAEASKRTRFTVLGVGLSRLPELAPYLLRAGTESHLRLAGARGLCRASTLYQHGYARASVTSVFDRVRGDVTEDWPPFLQLRGGVVARVLLAKELARPGVYGGSRVLYLGRLARDVRVCGGVSERE